MRGWLKLDRDIMSSQVAKCPIMLKVWIWCLTRANWSPAWVTTRTGRGTTEVKLEPGQFIFGRSTAAVALSMNESLVYSKMKKLVRMGNINMQTNTHYSIVTLCNWGTYQDLEGEDEQANSQPTNRQPTRNIQPTNSQPTAKNTVKKVLEGKECSKKVKEKVTAPAVHIPIELDNIEFNTAWGEWTAYRGKLKNKLLPESWQKQIDRFARHGSTAAIAAIENSIANGYQGVFPENFMKDKNGKPTQPKPEPKYRAPPEPRPT